MARLRGTPTPWSYLLIKLLFKFVLKIFYGTIVIENAHLIPENGRPCIVCANHGNSLTDAVVLVNAIPSEKRNMLRLTAKATLFGHKTFTSWLIESAGTVPIKRRKDYAEEDIDNSVVMLKLMEALEMGDAVCLFPEGISRYHPTLAPLKTGVARLVSDVLTRNRGNPDFEISVATCSITYMHRQHFRSDVLVSFHEPLTFRVKDDPELLDPVDFGCIRRVTTQMQHLISSGTIDSPSWELVRIATLANRIYAPLGTQMTLRDYVHGIRSFVDSFKSLEHSSENNAVSTATFDVFPDVADRRILRDDLKAYSDELARLGIKDERIRRPLPLRLIVFRMVIRFVWSAFLLVLSFPGLLLWLPIFATTFYAVHNFKKTGPIFDTWDEIAQYKLIYGLFSGLAVWAGAVLLTWPYAPFSVVLVPAFMWMTLRWFEDAVSSFRAFTALFKLLLVGKETVKKLHEKREDLRNRVMNLAIVKIGLPEDPETFFVKVGGKHKGQAKGKWDSTARYFSLRRRRKRDWNETLRLYDKVDYPADDE